MAKHFFLFSALLQLFIVLPHIDFCLRLVIAAYFATPDVTYPDDDIWAVPRTCEIQMWTQPFPFGWFNQLKRDDCSRARISSVVIMKFSFLNISIASRREILYSSIEFVELWTWILGACFLEWKRFCVENSVFVYLKPWTLHALTEFFSSRLLDWRLRKRWNLVGGSNDGVERSTTSVKAFAADESFTTSFRRKSVTRKLLWNLDFLCS